MYLNRIREIPFEYFLYSKPTSAKINNYSFNGLISLLNLYLEINMKSEL